MATDFPGLLVITDTWMPGWTARSMVSPYRSSGETMLRESFRCTRPGRHTIALDDARPGFAAGCAVTALSAVIWVVACGLMAISARKAGRPTVAQEPHPRISRANHTLRHEPPHWLTDQRRPELTRGETAEKDVAR